MGRVKKVTVESNSMRCRKRRQIQECQRLLHELSETIEDEQQRMLGWGATRRAKERMNRSIENRFEFENNVMQICANGVVNVVKENSELKKAVEKLDKKNVPLPLPLIEESLLELNKSTDVPMTSEDSDPFANLTSPVSRRKKFSKKREDMIDEKAKKRLARALDGTDDDSCESWTDKDEFDSSIDSNNLRAADAFNLSTDKTINKNYRRGVNIVAGLHRTANSSSDEEMDQTIHDPLAPSPQREFVQPSNVSVDGITVDVGNLSISDGEPASLPVTKSSTSRTTSDSCSASNSSSKKERNAQQSPFMNLGGRKLPYSDLLQFLKKQVSLPTNAERDRALKRLFMTTACKFMMSDDASDAMWNIVRGLVKVFQPGRKLPSLKTVYNHIKQLLPCVYIDYEFKDKKTGVIYSHHGVSYPKNAYPLRDFTCMAEWTYSPIQEIYKNHCQEHNLPITGAPFNAAFDICVDGVPLSHSGSKQMTLMVVRFQDCEETYLAGVHVYRKGHTMDLRRKIREWLINARDMGFNCNVAIADSPMRAKLKCLKGHSGRYSCDWCYAPGEVIKRGKLVYPYRSLDYKHRTHKDWLLTILRRKHRKERSMTDNECFGIKGKSPFLVLPNFDIVRQMPIEPMHNLFLGMTRGFLKLILKKVKGGSKIFKRFDRQWKTMCLPLEFNRRPRSLEEDFKNFKSGEYAAIVLCAPFMMARSIFNDDNAAVKKLWLLFSYLVRAFFLNDEHYIEMSSVVSMENLSKIFYAMWSIIFKDESCTFNLHEFSHLRETRKYWRYGQITAEPFESFFGYIKKVLRNNTLSFAKHVIYRCFIANMHEHKCVKTMKIKTKDTTANSINNLIYTRDRKFYTVIEETDQVLKCTEIVTSKYFRTEMPMLDYHQVGVAVFERNDVNVRYIPKADVAGKAVRDGRIILAVTNDMLKA